MYDRNMSPAITNVVCMGNIDISLDLTKLANSLCNVIYNPHIFNGLRWRHRHIPASCLVFSTGKLVCSGAPSIKLARKYPRQYARLSGKQGYPIQHVSCKLLTISMVHTLSAPLNYQQAHDMLSVQYEPEIFTGAMLKVGHVHFTCFRSGKVIITGLHSSKEIDTVVLPTLLELELCTENS